MLYQLSHRGSPAGQAEDVYKGKAFSSSLLQYMYRVHWTMYLEQLVPNPLRLAFVENTLPHLIPKSNGGGGGEGKRGARGTTSALIPLHRQHVLYHVTSDSYMCMYICTHVHGDISQRDKARQKQLHLFFYMYTYMYISSYEHTCVNIEIAYNCTYIRMYCM